MTDDGTLVDRACRGDPVAFEALVRRHYRAAFAVALGVLGNRMDAEDVCQDAFLRSLERLGDCRHPERFRAWLLQIVRNRARNALARRQIRRAERLEDVEPADDADPLRDAVRSDARGRLEAALATLGEVQRAVVLLHDLEGMKHKEIGSVLGISEVSSRQHLFVARRALRRRLSEARAQERSDG